MSEAWIADRMRHIEASGIRKAFDLSKKMVDPINLSIGLPDFDVPDSIKEAAISAIREGQNAYTRNSEPTSSSTLTPNSDTPTDP